MRPGWRAGAVENAGDVVGGIDDLEDAHAAAALATEGDGDGEHAGEELGPPEAARPRRGFGVVGLAARRVREAKRELLPGRRDRGRRNDARSEMMAICEHTEVSRHVKTRRRDEGAQPGEELVLAHVGMGRAAAPGGLEEDAHASVGERLDSVVGEGRAQHISADPLELFAVSAVDGGRGVEVHAERRLGQRRPRCRLGRRQEVNSGAALLESPVGGQAVEVDIQAELAPGPEPIDQLRARVPALALTWDPASRTLRLRFQRGPERVAEDVIAEVLRELLAAGARISALGKGRSLEQRYLDQGPVA
jgi:hypothetical protein